MLPRYEQLFPGLLKASVNYYGMCGNPKRQGDVPPLNLVGEADDWNNFGFVKTCREVFEMHTYPGAAHDFDDQMIRGGFFKGHPVGYDGPAAWDSYDRTKAFLDRYMGSRAN
jgi:dienelactone hydrolase